MNRFVLSHKDIKDGMCCVTDAAAYGWAYLWWRERLKYWEECLSKADDNEKISFYRYCVVEAKKVIIELYQKMIQMPEFSEGMISKPEWMEEFMADN